MIPSWGNILKKHSNHRVMGLAFFGIPYGMVFFLTMTTPQYWLHDLGISLRHIGLFGLVALPYVFKFIWAPLVDLIEIPWLCRKIGHRRSWLVFIHVSLMVGLLLMGFSNPASHFFYSSCIAFFLAFLGATQDIIVDAYRIEVLNKDESAPGVSMLIFGYRVGALLAKAGTLHLAAAYSWQIAYMVMAVCILTGVFATLLNPEPQRAPIERKLILQERILWPFQEFMKRSKFWWLVLIFTVIYRLPDAMLHNVAGFFYDEIGFSRHEIANVVYMFGTGASILGGFVGGILLQRTHVFNGLLITGVLHTVSNLMFVVLHHTGNNLSILGISITLENITGGMSTAALMIYLSRLCQRQFALSQFALLSSLWSLSTPLASFSGQLVEVLNKNWDYFFYISSVVAIPGLWIIFYLKKYPLGTQVFSKRK